MVELYIARIGGMSGGSAKTDISTATVTLDSTPLVYDGTLKTQNVTVTIGGQTLVAGTDYSIINNAYTNAGNYTMTIMGTGNYKGTKTVDWSIAKATGSISANPTSLSIQGVGSTDTSALTVVGDGIVSVDTSDSSVATATVNGNTVTVTTAATGSVNITVTLAAGTNYTGSNATISVTVMTVDPILANNTPAQIAEAAYDGTASTIWSVGDKTAAISISAIGNMSATSACAFILGFNHNSSKEGTGIHFQFGKTTVGTDIAFIDSGYSTSKTSGTWFNMNNSQTNNGGWKISRMNTTVCPAFLSALPSDWQNVITSCPKYTYNYDSTDQQPGPPGASQYVNMNMCKIWLLSEWEVFGVNTYAHSDEKNYQTQYDYYKNGNSAKKYKHNSTSTVCDWWLRSANSSGTNAFCYVNNTSVFYEGAIYSKGFAPGFRIA